MGGGANGKVCELGVRVQRFSVRVEGSLKGII